jgi:hypothetical protein
VIAAVIAIAVAPDRTLSAPLQGGRAWVGRRNAASIFLLFGTMTFTLLHWSGAVKG